MEKPEVHYVGEYYVFGSEVAVPKPQPAKKLPQKDKGSRKGEARILYVDPVAFCGVVAAVVMLCILIVGSFRLRDLRAEYDRMQDYLSGLKRENAALSHLYHTSYDLETIRDQAERSGMVEPEKAESFTVFFSEPEREQEPTAWDEFVWLFSGLFSQPHRAGTD